MATLPRRVAAATVIILVLVLMGGTLVTKTGSGDACGETWPLCYGQWLPPLQINSIIEYSHRLVSSISGFFVLGTAILAWRRFGHHREIRFLVSAALFFLLVQGALGAWAVMAPQSPLVMALHFGVSLLAFASVLLPYVLMTQVSTGSTLRQTPVGTQLRAWVWLALVYIYGLVYTGAYVRHTSSQFACLDWPLCGGALIPELSGAMGIQFFHRFAAFVGLLIIMYLWTLAAREAHQRPDLYRGASIALLIVTLQVLAGGIMLLTQLQLGWALLHSALVIALFGALSYLALQVTPEMQESGSARAERPAVARHATSP